MRHTASPLVPRFNTQPPEGGWCRTARIGAPCAGVSTHSRLKAAGSRRQSAPSHRGRFNTQPPEGGWKTLGKRRLRGRVVSTHSRLKAAGADRNHAAAQCAVSTHSRLKAAGPVRDYHWRLSTCFNTQPPEGGWSLSQNPCSIRFSSPDFARLTRKARTRV